VGGTGIPLSSRWEKKFDAIREFMTPTEVGHREIGIHTKK